ncbi:NAD(P)/FAD-dependent oxidoreductase [Oceaniglobus ichthyenteri]|uniref:NAD(P)/FAD-dependent oxidoreductase n=1 Tax=Oceaniglobus ichthyenteri TaxID=2136177 RepID=UPI000D3B3A72|nr:FAD-binding oxidoreductase [Oceaniglobus ichthyenteri]
MNLLFANDTPGAYPPSWYAETAQPLPESPPLRENLRADICIVGAGYTGLSAALHLAQAGFDVAVVEAQRVGFGASGRNGGQVGTGQRQGQDWLERHAPADARALWDIAEAAKATVQELITTHGIDASYRPGIAYAERSAAGVAKAHSAAAHLAREYGYDQIEPLDRAAMRGLIGSDMFVGGVIDRGAGHLHPLQFALGLARAAQKAGVRFYENSPVTRVENAHVLTEQGSVRCDHVILACNGYLGGLNAPVAARVMPINNFIIATEPLGARAKTVLTQDIAAADDRFVVNYWRLSGDNRLLFGGGESYGYRFPNDIAAVVRKPMLQIYPQLKDVTITHAWGGTLAITMNRMPHFSRNGTIYNASGYSGHGVAMATQAGKMIANAIAGDATQFDTMARLPNPRFPGGPALRAPLLALAMTWYSLRDRIGF